MSADEHLNEDQLGAYRIPHQPTPDGYQMHEAHKAYPDVVEHPEYYSHPASGYSQSLRDIRRVNGNPEASVDMYRAAPSHVTAINHGDWVTTSKQYAQQHGRHATDPKQDWPVLHMKARAKDLRGAGDDVNEWGYFPEK